MFYVNAKLDRSGTIPKGVWNLPTSMKVHPIEFTDWKWGITFVQGALTSQFSFYWRAQVKNPNFKCFSIFTRTNGIKVRLSMNLGDCENANRDRSISWYPLCIYGNSFLFIDFLLI